MRYDIVTRAKALEAGIWTTSQGRLVPLARMHDAHLINALLQALGTSEPQTIVLPLSKEIMRRGLADAAFAEATRRMS